MGLGEELPEVLNPIKDYVLRSYRMKPKRSVVEISPRNLVKVFKALIKHYGELNLYLSTIEGTDLKSEGRIRIDYFINIFSKGEYVVLRTYVDRNKPEIDSLLPITRAAFSGECETYDLLGIKFIGNKYLRRSFFVPKDLVEKGVFPLRKDSGV